MVGEQCAIQDVSIIFHAFALELQSNINNA